MKKTEIFLINILFLLSAVFFTGVYAADPSESVVESNSSDSDKADSKENIY